MGDTNMTGELAGSVFVFVAFAGLGLVHRVAAHDPYRNFFTQLLFTWYDAHSTYQGDALRRMLRLCSFGYFAGAGLFAVLALVTAFGWSA